MKYTKKELSFSEFTTIVNKQEDWFSDKKSKNIKPSKLSRTISAFANANGGDIYIGISCQEDKNSYYWDGFSVEEDTNPYIALLDEMMPTCEDFIVECFTYPDYDSVVLHFVIHKTQTIIYASDQKAYIRNGTQNLPCNTDDKLLRLRMDKGLASFEDEVTQCVFDEIKNSSVLNKFISQIVPQSSGYDWLRSQRVMKESAKLTVAGVLLYDECPQAILPKQSAIRILRYHTDEREGTRESLQEGFPISIEGDIYNLIVNAVSKVAEIVESVEVVGTQKIEAKKYPYVTLHEIITNAVLHRDYSILKDIQVRVFTNRIEVESPGLLPGHITLKNILKEQFSRNPKIVRLISKFPAPPNKDAGEGLNTAFAAMLEMHLQKPQIFETEHSVVVIIKHERLADAESIVLEYMQSHQTINNLTARQITGISDANKMKRVFIRLKEKKYLKIVPGTRSSATLWMKDDSQNDNSKPSLLEQITLL